MFEERAQTIAGEYITRGKAANRSKGASNIPPELVLLHGYSFTIYDPEHQPVCQGSIVEDEGKKSRMFRFKMEGVPEEPEPLCQADLCTKLNLKANYTLTQHIVLDCLGLSISQLSARVGLLLPPVIVARRGAAAALNEGPPAALDGAAQPDV